MYSEREFLREADDTFHPVLLRFGTIYGLSSRMRFDLVVNTMTAHAYFNKTITVDGGSQWRPLLHVDDAARACLAALEAPLSKVSKQIFNVGSTSDNYTIADIALAVAAEIPGAQIHTLNTVRDRRDYRVSFDKINRVLHFKTMHTVPHGIRELVRVMEEGKFKDWKDSKYSDYLTLKNILAKEG